MKTSKPLLTRELRAISQKLIEKTGFRLKNYLIEQAFTRSSYSRRYGGENNENLEFIGDTILGYHIVHRLFEHYGTLQSDSDGCSYVFRAHERDLTVLKNRVVSNSTLAAVMDEWDLCQYLIVGKSDIDNGIDKQEKIRADLLEAIVGAYAVQTAWDTEIMDGIISRILPVDRYIVEYEAAQYRPPEFSADNAVNTLKELAEHEKCPFPQYTFDETGKFGRNAQANPKWFCRVIIPDRGIIKFVQAYSKKDAKKYAAYLALCEMFNLPNEFGTNKSLTLWHFDGKTLEPGLLEDS